MARKFLYVVAALIGLFIVAGIIWSLFSTQLMQVALVPKEDFVAPKAVVANAYADKAMWIAHPELKDNPARFQPEGMEPETEEMPGHAVFFIHPTSYLTGKHWNAPLDDREANDRAALFVRGQASVFNKTPFLWAPRYRQAAFGAFLTDEPQAQQALDAAYADVSAAFDEFVSKNSNKPLILAGHSQGALHLLRLLQEKVKDKPIAKRIIAVYPIGWPIALTADLPALGFPACEKPDQAGCIASWQSFAEPASYDDILEGFESKSSLTGKQRRGDQLLCTNPLTGTANGEAPMSANMGTLKNEPDFSGGTLVAKAVPARCDDRGILLIGDPPELGPYVLPGNNYHVYDFSLFWANIRVDVNRRVMAFGAK